MDMKSAWNDLHYLYFDYAYCFQNAGDGSDVLQILVSRDCGANFEPLQTFSGADLVTLAPLATPFSPGSGDWNTKKVSMWDYRFDRNVIIKLEQTRGEGNNLFLDNFRFELAVGIDDEHELWGNIHEITLCPNPVSDIHRATIALQTGKPLEITMNVFDNTGRKLIEEVHQCKKGENNISFNTRQFAPGIYFVQINDGERSYVRRLVVLN